MKIILKIFLSIILSLNVGFASEDDGQASYLKKRTHRSHPQKQSQTKYQRTTSPFDDFNDAIYNGNLLRNKFYYKDAAKEYKKAFDIFKEHGEFFEAGSVSVKNQPQNLLFYAVKNLHIDYRDYDRDKNLKSVILEMYETMLNDADVAQDQTLVSKVRLDRARFYGIHIKTQKKMLTELEWVKIDAENRNDYVQLFYTYLEYRKYYKEQKNYADIFEAYTHKIIELKGHLEESTLSNKSQNYIFNIINKFKKGMQKTSSVVIKDRYRTQHD